MRRGLDVPAAAPHTARRQRRGRSVPSSRSLGGRPAGRRSGKWQRPCAPRLRREAVLKGSGCRWASRSWEGTREVPGKHLLPPRMRPRLPRTGRCRGFGASDVLRRPRRPPRRGPGAAAPGRAVSGVRGVLEGQGPALPDSRLRPQGPLTPPPLDTRGQRSPTPTPLGLSCSGVEEAPRDAGCFSTRRSSQTASPVAPERGALPLVLPSFPNLGAPRLPSQEPDPTSCAGPETLLKGGGPRCPPPAGAET